MRALPKGLYLTVLRAKRALDEVDASTPNLDHVRALLLHAAELCAKEQPFEPERSAHSEGFLGGYD